MSQNFNFILRKQICTIHAMDQCFLNNVLLRREYLPVIESLTGSSRPSLNILSIMFDTFIEILIVLGFIDALTLVGHFVSSPREREKCDRRDSRGDERERQERKRKMNESEETEEIKHSPSTLTCYKDSRPCLTVSQYHLDAPVTTPSPHPTTPFTEIKPI